MSSRCHQRHTGNSGRKLAAQIAHQMAAILPNIVAQLHQQLAPAPTIQPNKKPYTGSFPLCNSCNYHHPATTPCCKCTKCGRFGHLHTTCRLLAQPNQPNVPLIAPPNNQPAGRACY